VKKKDKWGSKWCKQANDIHVCNAQINKWINVALCSWAETGQMSTGWNMSGKQITHICLENSCYKGGGSG